MKYKRLTLSALVFVLLFIFFSWLLVNSSAEIFLEYQTSRPVDVLIYPSLPFERAIGKKAYPAVLQPSDSKRSAFVRVKIPLSCLRKFYLEIPAGSDIELVGGGFRIFYFFKHSLGSDELFLGKSTGGLELVTLLTPKTGLPKSIKLQTPKSAGGCEIQLTNDFPRCLAFLCALGISLAAALFCSVLWSETGLAIFQTVLFLILLCGSTVISGLFSISAEGKNSKPSLNLQKLSDYPEKFNQWYRRNLPFRDSLYSLHYNFCRWLGISPVKQVIRGQDDWLFLGRYFTQTPHEDYLGNNLFTDSELQQIRDRLIFARDSLKKKNIRFCIFIIPAKMLVYGHMLRKEWQRKDPNVTTRSRQLVDYLRKNSDIPMEYPLDEILAYQKKIPVPLYYKHDTHWNFLGAYIGARSMMRLIDPQAAVRMPEVSSLKYGNSGMHYGDLARMAEAPKSFLEPEWQFQHPAFHYSQVPGDVGCYSFQGKSSGGKRVFFIRDSFMTGMGPFLMEYLSYSTFYWDFTLNLSMISDDRPDVVVLEMVDRFLPLLLNFQECKFRMRRGAKML